MGEGAAWLHRNTAVRRRQRRGGGPPRRGTPSHPGYPAANLSAEAAPEEARGPCAVTAPHCLQQPPSMGFWPSRRHSRDHRDAATGTGLRSGPAVPAQGPHVPDAQGNGKTFSPGPPKLGSLSASQHDRDLVLHKVPAVLQDPCPALFLAQQRSARSSRQCSQGSCPKAAPKPRCANQYPCGSTLLGAETSPTHHTSYVVLQPCQPAGSRIRNKLSSRHPTMIIVGGHTASMSTSSIAKPLRGHCASHLHEELWHPTDQLLWPQGYFGVTFHSATCMPAQCPWSTLSVGSQFQAGTSIHVLLDPRS